MVRDELQRLGDWDGTHDPLAPCPLPACCRVCRGSGPCSPGPGTDASGASKPLCKGDQGNPCEKECELKRSELKEAFKEGDDEFKGGHKSVLTWPCPVCSHRYDRHYDDAGSQR